MSDSIPIFGAMWADHYIDRPGAYGVVQDNSDRIAVVRHLDKYYLPGGGIELGETPQRCLQRELEEEIGWTSQVGMFVGIARECVYAEAERTHFNKIGHFFIVSLLTRTAAEPEHDLHWLTPSDAEARLDHGSHVWAVQRVIQSERR